jgi:hypothetical protein
LKRSKSNLKKLPSRPSEHYLDPTQPTPLAGATFSIYVVDFLTGLIHEDERLIPFDEALEWQRQWMTKDQVCSPLIVRSDYTVPQVINLGPSLSVLASPPAPTPSSEPAKPKLSPKRRPPGNPRRSTKLIS